MRAARFKVSTEFIHELLHLPASALIIGASMPTAGGAIEFIVDDPSLPEADQPVDVVPTHRCVEFDYGLPVGV